MTDFWVDPLTPACLAAGVLLLSLRSPARTRRLFCRPSCPAGVMKGSVTHSRAANTTRQLLSQHSSRCSSALVRARGSRIPAAPVRDQRCPAGAGRSALRDRRHDMRFAVHDVRRLTPWRARSRLLEHIGFLSHGLKLYMPTRKRCEGGALSVAIAAIDHRTLSLYGVKPLAGRLMKEGPAAAGQALINETAVRKMGFASPLTRWGRHSRSGSWIVRAAAPRSWCGPGLPDHSGRSADRSRVLHACTPAAQHAGRDPDWPANPGNTRGNRRAVETQTMKKAPPQACSWMSTSNAPTAR